MKTLCLTLAIIFICSSSYADSLNVKFGVADYLVEGLDASPRAEISYEYNPETWLGIELGVGGTSSNAHDTQVEVPWATGKSMGRLTTLDYFVTAKFYYKDFHIGGGISYLDTYFKENYDASADWDDEIGCHAQVGWQFAPNWTLINKWGWADIDTESGKSPTYIYGYKFTNGILEEQSNQHYWAVMVERKF